MNEEFLFFPTTSTIRASFPFSGSPGYSKYLTKLPTFTRKVLLPKRATATPRERCSQPTFDESDYHPLFPALVIGNESLFYKQILHI